MVMVLTSRSVRLGGLWSRHPKLVNQPSASTFAGSIWERADSNPDNVVQTTRRRHAHGE